MMRATPVVKMRDMDEEMEADALALAAHALDQFSSEKEQAQYVRKAFVDKYNGVWHCIVGRKFGAYATYEAKHQIYFYIGQAAFLLFKTS